MKDGISDVRCMINDVWRMRQSEWPMANDEM